MPFDRLITYLFKQRSPVRSLCLCCYYAPIFLKFSYACAIVSPNPKTIQFNISIFMSIFFLIKFHYESIIKARNHCMVALYCCLVKYEFQSFPFFPQLGRKYNINLTSQYDNLLLIYI